jgi:hypothetical protein
MDRIVSTIGTISTGADTGTIRLIAAAMAPMSTPALIVLATARPATTG